MERIFFGKLNSPTFVFMGRHGDKKVSCLDVFFDYPLSEIKENQSLFFDSVANIYQQEKYRNPISNTRLLDLGNPAHLMGMRRHLRVHAVTGLPELGTSTTESIPYWDRQGFIAGLKHVCKQDWKYYQQMVDLECVNALRSILAIYVPKYRYARMCIQNLTELAERKECFTRSDIRQSIQKQTDAWNEISGNYRRVLLGKVKHLVFCLDKIDDRDIRVYCLDELDTLLVISGFEKDDLSIDLGCDGGVTESTYRPQYQIRTFLQLKHLGVDIVSVSNSAGVVWGYSEWRNSLTRFSGQSSLLTDPEEFLLDWKFD